MKTGHFLTLAALLWLSGCATVPRPQVCAPVIAPQPPGVYHIVEKGQTLWRIAHIYGIEMRSLMAVNGISDPSRIETGRKLLIPRGSPPARCAAPAVYSEAAIEHRIQTSSPGPGWRTITIHHSATRYGNGKVFDKYHKRLGMGGLFYHFLIGNGNGLGDGEIQVGWRWKKQREVNRPKDIQICLVGNFMKQDLSARQYESLKGLIIALRRRYGITARAGVRRHCDVVNAGKATECPGKKLPYAQLLRDLNQ